MQFYLPDEAVINKDFMKAVLAGQKDLLKKDQVKEITVPKYDELSVKSIYPMFKKDAVMMKYFPDVYPKGKGPPREYFFNILNTLHGDYLQQIMGHASKQRMTAEGEAQKKEVIKISEYWSEQLASMPYLSCKCHFITFNNLMSRWLQRRMARPSTCSSPRPSLRQPAARDRRSPSSAPSASTPTRRRRRWYPARPLQSRMCRTQDRAAPPSSTTWRRLRKRKMPRWQTNEISVIYLSVFHLSN